MTQEQLAQRLGVSPQAVSKWESGTNMPDIQMLPDLSVIFGVTIDNLFDMTDASRMERIENMLDSVRFLSEEDFRSAEGFLKDCRSRSESDGEATLLLATLYNKRAQEYHELAAPLARKALELLPGRKAAHNAVFDAENGPYQDWNFVNHHKLIDFYKDVVKKHPGAIEMNRQALQILREDWTTEGESIDRYHREIRRLEELL